MQTNYMSRIVDIVEQSVKKTLKIIFSFFAKTSLTPVLHFRSTWIFRRNGHGSETLPVLSEKYYNVPDFLGNELELRVVPLLLLLVGLQAVDQFLPAHGND
jgi:hypothetical protein